MLEIRIVKYFTKPLDFAQRFQYACGHKQRCNIFIAPTERVICCLYNF